MVTLRDHYDVVIVGAGVSGLECAKTLCDSNLRVLILEKNRSLGRKTCAGGVTLQDLEYIPRRVLNFPLKRIRIHYKDLEAIFPKREGFISTINREKLSSFYVRYIERHKNISILTGRSVSRIISDNSLKLDNGRRVKFNFLVGADGASSIVRRYLCIPVKKMEFAIQYKIPRRFHDFEIYLDDERFGTGYLWVFPHRDFTYIGSGSDMKYIDPKTLKSNLELWLRSRRISLSNAKLEGALINYDYKGYRFNNFFLVGDAAGLTSGLTGKGIYAALISGRQVALEIMGKEKGKENLISRWLKEKRKQERYMSFVKNKVLRKIAFSIGINALKTVLIQHNLINSF